MKSPEWLPDWFDINNYDSLASMDLFGWAQALQFREFLKSESAKVVYKTNEGVVERLACLSKNPDDVVSCWSGADNARLIPVRYDLLERRTVDSLTIGTIAAIWGDLTSKDDAAKFKHDLEIGSEPKNPELAEQYSRLEDATYDEFYMTYFQRLEGEDDQQYNSRYMQYMGGFTFAQVDISAPDELLVEDFKKWLKDIRDLMGVSTQSQKFTPAQMADWHAKRVLPYIDLTIWAGLMGISITQHQLGIVLFPDDYDISLSERVRRTVKPLADNLMRPSTVGAICMQANLPHY